jgi:hypothetical protein
MTHFIQLDFITSEGKVVGRARYENAGNFLRGIFLRTVEIPVGSARMKCTNSVYNVDSFEIDFYNKRGEFFKDYIKESENGTLEFEVELHRNAAYCSYAVNFGSRRDYFDIVTLVHP